MPWPFRRRLSVDFIRVPTEPSGAQLVERFLVLTVPVIPGRTS